MAVSGSVTDEKTSYHIILNSLTSPWRFFTRFNSYKNGFNSYKNGFNSYMIIHDSVIIFKNKTPENIQFSYKNNAHFKNSRKIA